jgi:hypothetical protein
MIKNARILKTIKEKLTKDENRYPLSSYKLGTSHIQGKATLKSLTPPRRGAVKVKKKIAGRACFGVLQGEVAVGTSCDSGLSSPRKRDRKAGKFTQIHDNIPKNISHRSMIHEIINPCLIGLSRFVIGLEHPTCDLWKRYLCL